MEHRIFGIDPRRMFRSVSRLGDPARSEEHEAPVEARQGQQRLPRLFAVRALIQPATPVEDSPSSRLELVSGRLLRLGREDVDARR